jgi:tetratricopeptide (TPR) repeat protein
MPSSIPEANDLFARAMALQRLQNDIPNAMNLLQRAIDLDPNFAEAHRYHAFDYVTLLLNGFTNDTGVLDKADEELRLVAKLAPDLESLPSAQTALYLTKGQREYIPLQRLEQVLRDNPDQMDSAIWRMMLHTYAGENAASKALAKSMLDREPTLGPPRFLRGELLRTEGDIAGAIRDEKAILEVAPRNLIAIRSLALAYMDSGDIAKARTTLEEQRSVYADNFMWRQAWALLLAVEGKTQEAKAAMDPETLKFASLHFQSTLQTAEYYAVLGDPASAIQWVRLAVGLGDERVDWFRKNPRLASLQKDPEFLRIVENIEGRRKK